ncbi:MAG: hypothetical protein IT423_17155 [Pirellulaceae bacterium]|nr:hypothetical protein [Pirellulaceae bacterium]
MACQLVASALHNRQFDLKPIDDAVCVLRNVFRLVSRQRRTVSMVGYVSTVSETVAFRFVSRLMILCSLVCFYSGCGPSNPETFPVKGKVTYNGQAVKNGIIMFTPEGEGNAANGSLEADGTYQMTTFVANDGARSGKYKVSIQVFPGADEGGGLPGQEFAGKKPPIPPKYGQATTSGLTAEVKDVENTIDFTLK